MSKLLESIQSSLVNLSATLASIARFALLAATIAAALASVLVAAFWVQAAISGDKGNFQLTTIVGTLTDTLTNLTTEQIVAAFGATIAILVSYLTYAVTKNQAETQVLDFVEKNLRPGSETCLRMISGFEQLFVAANDISDFVADQVMPRLFQRIKNGTDVVTAIDESCAEFESELKQCIEQIERRVRQISADFQNVGHSLFFHAFLRAQLKDSLRKGDIFRCIKTSFSEETIRHLFGAHQSGLNYEMRNISERLNGYASLTTPVELILAHLVIPNKYTTLDYLGATLFITSFQPKPNAHKIDRVYFNMGRAYLTVILQHLPEKPGLKRALRKLMPGQTGLIQRLLKDLPIDRSDYSSPSWLESIDREIIHPERTILVDESSSGKSQMSFATRTLLRSTRNLQPQLN